MRHYRLRPCAVAGLTSRVQVSPPPGALVAGTCGADALPTALPSTGVRARELLPLALLADGNELAADGAAQKAKRSGTLHGRGRARGSRGERRCATVAVGPTLIALSQEGLELALQALIYAGKASLAVRLGGRPALLSRPPVVVPR